MGNLGGLKGVPLQRLYSPHGKIQRGAITKAILHPATVYPPQKDVQHKLIFDCILLQKFSLSKLLKHHTNDILNKGLNNISKSMAKCFRNKSCNQLTMSPNKSSVLHFYDYINLFSNDDRTFLDPMSDQIRAKDES